jgi:hypothetical protein
MNDYFGILTLVGVFAGTVYYFFRGTKERKMKGRETVALLLFYQARCSLGFVVIALLYDSFGPEGKAKLLFIFVEGIVIGVLLGIHLAMRVLGLFKDPNRKEEKTGSS